MQALDLDQEKRERDKQELRDGLAMLDRKKEQKERDKQIEKRQLRKMLDDEPWPWGRPGAGAPNADTIRKRKVFLDSLPAIVGPQDMPKAKGLQLTHVTTMGRPGAGAPVRSKSGKIKVLRVEDPQLRFQFHAPIRNMVDNDLRYKQPFEDKIAYKKELDQLIEQRKRIKSEQRKQNQIQDCKLGWTDPKLIERMQENIPKPDRPQADYGHPSFESNKEMLSLPMLPLDRHFLPPSKEPKTWVVYVIKNPRPSKIPIALRSPLSSAFDSSTTMTSPGPPSPPTQPRPTPRPVRVDPIKEPIWRDTAGEKEYGEALAHQIEEQQHRRQEERNQDLMNSRKHFENWQNFWGRPGHGAPRSVKVKENLDYLLYHLPLITSKGTNMIK
ncbi:unnamed protein product [Bemisia tabaci]|uniref:Uncharacterized protein n=1 Tax=Bemisia tabaci TaxID=7038 RepID=A0A9P0AHX9_BEMTA|nr:unnamed protein product [Bemisia tabaci]